MCDRLSACAKRVEEAALIYRAGAVIRMDSNEAALVYRAGAAFCMSSDGTALMYRKR